MHSKVEVGDKVRIVYEGEVREVNTWGDIALVGKSGVLHDHHYSSVEVVKKRKKKLKIGDHIANEEQMKQLPTGTVLADEYCAYTVNGSEEVIRDFAGEIISFSEWDYTLDEKIIFIPAC